MRPRTFINRNSAGYRERSPLRLAINVILIAILATLGPWNARANDSELVAISEITKFTTSPEACAADLIEFAELHLALAENPHSQFIPDGATGLVVGATAGLVGSSIATKDIGDKMLEKRRLKAFALHTSMQNIGFDIARRIQSLTKPGIKWGKNLQFGMHVVLSDFRTGYPRPTVAQSMERLLEPDNFGVDKSRMTDTDYRQLQADLERYRKTFGDYVKKSGIRDSPNSYNIHKNFRERHAGRLLRASGAAGGALVGLLAEESVRTVGLNIACSEYGNVGDRTDLFTTSLGSIVTDENSCIMSVAGAVRVFEEEARKPGTLEKWCKENPQIAQAARDSYLTVAAAKKQQIEEGLTEFKTEKMVCSEGKNPGEILVRNKLLEAQMIPDPQKPGKYSVIIERSKPYRPDTETVTYDVEFPEVGAPTFEVTNGARIRPGIESRTDYNTMLNAFTSRMGRPNDQTIARVYDIGSTLNVLASVREVYEDFCAPSTGDSRGPTIPSTDTTTDGPTGNTIRGS